jgi:transposase
MNTSPIRIELSTAERMALESRARGQRIAHRDAVRAKIILRLAEGHSLSEVAVQVERDRKVVRKWAKRFVNKRLQGLADKAGRGRAPVFSPGARHAPGEARL